MSVRSPMTHHELSARLQDILDEAHSQHVYRTDHDQYGTNEFWEPGLLGDCEDFALWCRDRLKALYGLDSHLIYCLTEQGEGHLVLSRDGWVLDNRYPIVIRRDALPYTWIAAGLPDGTWRRIQSKAPAGSIQH